MGQAAGSSAVATYAIRKFQDLNPEKAVMGPQYSSNWVLIKIQLERSLETDSVLKWWTNDFFNILIISNLINISLPNDVKRVLFFLRIDMKNYSAHI